VIIIILVASCASARDLRIGVFGLLHPRQLQITCPTGQMLTLATGSHQVSLSGGASAFLDLEGDRIRVRSGDETFAATEVRVTSASANRADFLLSVPGKLARQFRGRLDVECRIEELVAVVEMDLETAVASAVAAESAPEASLEALKAQAVATRSYYLASRSRHGQIDFCDTTHCQFLREAPSSQSGAAQAAAATQGMVLLYDGAPVPALFTGSCGGRTRTLAEVGLAPAPYPYFSVPCKYCLQHSPHWQVRLEAEDAAGLRAHSEAGRLRLGRILGWDVVPGNNYELRPQGDAVMVEGRGKGHGVGLCQLGAAWMAGQGRGFQEILAYYYPNTVVAGASN
jgi:stage II sporulation protein D